MRKRLLALGVGLAALVAALVVAPSAAQAHHVGTYTTLSTTSGYPFPSFDGDGGCHQGYVCEWTSVALVGWGVGFYLDNWDYSAPGVPTSGGTSINNNSESWVNWGFDGSFDEVRLYDGAGGVTLLACIENGNSITSNGSLANRISSHVWVTDC